MGDKFILVSLIAVQVPCEKLQKQISFLSLTVVGTSQVLKRFLLSFETVHEYYSIFRFQFLKHTLYCEFIRANGFFEFTKEDDGAYDTKYSLEVSCFYSICTWNNPGIRLISLV